MGNVSVNHDTSHRHEVNDHSVNYHIQQAPNERGQWNLLLIIAVMLGLMGVVLALGLLKGQQPAALPPMTETGIAAPQAPVIVQQIVNVPGTPESAPNKPVEAPPSAPIKPEPPPPPIKVSTPPSLEMTASKPRYQAGEVVVLTLKARREGYVRVLYRDAGGQTTQVLPNAVHDGHLLPHQSLVWDAESLRRAVPGTNKEQVLRMRVSGPPFGHEEFVAVFSPQPYADTKTLMSELSTSRTGMSQTVVSKALTLEVEEVLKTTPSREGTEEVRLPIETVPAP